MIGGLPHPSSKGFIVHDIPIGLLGILGIGPLAMAGI